MFTRGYRTYPDISWENEWIPPDVPLFQSIEAGFCHENEQNPGQPGSLLGLAAASDCARPGV